MRGRRLLRYAFAGIAVVGLTACQGVSEPPQAVSPQPTPSPSVDPTCAPFEAYGVNQGERVVIETSLPAAERTALAQAAADFVECTGIELVVQGGGTSELLARLGESNPPDAAILSGPALIGPLVEQGALVAAPSQAVLNVAQFWNPAWRAYGSVDDTLYAVPLGATVNSLVWYSPKKFKEWQLDVPTTWDDMLDVSDALAAAGVKPWCGGVFAGDATGWPAASWLSELMLRLYGGGVYDQWVANEVKFLSPQVIGAMEVLDYWLRNPDYVNGGFGDAASIAATPVQEVGRSVLDGECGMIPQGSDYAQAWQSLKPDVAITSTGDIFAFPLPAMSDAAADPVIGEGQLLVAFNDRDAVRHVMSYVSSAGFANARAELGGWISANNRVAPGAYADPIERLAASMLAKPDSAFRIDGAALIPGNVTVDAFWPSMASWFAGTASTEEVLATIDASWPPSLEE